MAAVVGIHAGNELALAVIQAPVERYDDSAVVLSHQSQTLVFISPGLQSDSGVIYRTIINCNDFEIGVGLAQQRLHRLIDRLSGVVARHHNRYKIRLRVMIRHVLYFATERQSMTISDLSWDEILQAIIGFLPTLALAVLVFFIAYLLSKWLTRVVRRAMRRRNQDPEMTVLLEMLTRWGILIIGIVMALQVLAPGRFASLLAGLGVAGVTIGFALQDVAKNFVAGILLLIQQPFEIGDTIEVSGFTGEVLKIALRATEMREVDGRYVIIPNGDVFVSPIVNFSRAPRRRIELSVGVGYDSDLDQVARLAYEAILKIPGVLDEPAPSIVFNEFGGSAIGVKTYYWIDTDDTGVFDGTSEGLKLLKMTFEENGIDMPFPTMTILSPK